MVEQRGQFGSKVDEVGVFALSLLHLECAELHSPGDGGRFRGRRFEPDRVPVRALEVFEELGGAVVGVDVAVVNHHRVAREQEL